MKLVVLFPKKRAVLTYRAGEAVCEVGTLEWQGAQLRRWVLGCRDGRKYEWNSTAGLWTHVASAAGWEVVLHVAPNDGVAPNEASWQKLADMVSGGVHTVYLALHRTGFGDSITVKTQSLRRAQKTFRKAQVYVAAFYSEAFDRVYAAFSQLMAAYCRAAGPSGGVSLDSLVRLGDAVVKQGPSVEARSILHRIGNQVAPLLLDLEALKESSCSASDMRNLHGGWSESIETLWQELRGLAFGNRGTMQAALGLEANNEQLGDLFPKRAGEGAESGTAALKAIERVASWLKGWQERKEVPSVEDVDRAVTALRKWLVEVARFSEKMITKRPAGESEEAGGSS